MTRYFRRLPLHEPSWLCDHPNASHISAILLTPKCYGCSWNCQLNSFARHNNNYQVSVSLALKMQKGLPQLAALDGLDSEMDSPSQNYKHAGQAHSSHSNADC